MPSKQTDISFKSKIRWGVVGTFVLLLVAAAFDAPGYFNRAIDAVNNKTALGLPRIPSKAFSLGLDLQGGAHLIYKANVDKIAEKDKGAAVEGVRDVIERRVNGLGISEAQVQTAKIANEYQVLVDLPGVTDVKQAIEKIGDTPILEFKEQNTTPARQLTKEEKTQLDKDNAATKKNAEDVLKRINSNQLKFDEAAKQYSEDSQSKNNGGLIGFITKDYPLEWYNWAAAAKPDEISSKLIQIPAGYTILKRGTEQAGQLEDTASHILICYLGATGCTDAQYTKQEAQAKANELFKQANAKNFADLAKQYSSDAANKDKGGDLGAVTKDKLVKPFADALFSAQVGQIIGPVETEFGYHIIYKRAENQTKEYQLYAVFFKTKTEADILPPHEEFKATGLSGAQLKRAEVVTDQRTGDVQVSLSFNDEGAKLFEQITEKNLNKPVAIYLDDKPISTPVVQTVIRDGKAVITNRGGFTFDEAKLLAQRLNTGALPVPVELLSQQTVGATLGSESMQRSLYAGIIGVLLIMVFMVLYYRLPGLIAVIGLAVYITLSLAIFKIIGVTLSLAGIAGLIFSIGVAVDANVLIFERMKEELWGGRSLRSALEEGFLRAWPSIRDSNVTTLISSVLMISFGSSFVKGFALTLTIGVLVSMFTAITVTRILLRFVVSWFGEYGNFLFRGAKKLVAQEEK